MVEELYRADESGLTRTKQLSTVAPVTCIAVTRVKPIVRLCVGFGQTVELSASGLFTFRFSLVSVTSKYIYPFLWETLILTGILA